MIGTLEYRYHLPRAFDPQPKPDVLFGKPFRTAPQQPGGRTDWDMILRAFVDAVQVWHNEKLGFEDDVRLLGTGVGMEFVLKQNLRFRADWGVALKDAENGGDSVSAGSSQVHLQFTILY